MNLTLLLPIDRLPCVSTSDKLVKKGKLNGVGMPDGYRGETELSELRCGLAQ